MTLNIKIHHGEKFVVGNGGIWEYIGGEVHYKSKLDPEKLSRLEILWCVWGLGYKNCGPIYYQLIGTTNYVELTNDTSVVNMLKQKGEMDWMDIYVDALPDDFINYGDAQMEDKNEVDLVALMVISRIPTVNLGPFEVGENGCVGEATQNEGDAAVDLDKDQVCEGNAEEATPDSDTESKTTDDELYNVEIDDDNGSEKDTEVQEVKKSVKSYRRERSRRNRPVDPAVMEFTLVGTDKGFESYLREGNKYAGLLGGDEDYIGSSDVDSFASDDGREDEKEHRRVRRATKRVHYDPECKEPLWELGMVFKSVYEFRDAVANYAVTRRVDLDFAKNDYNRVRMICRENYPWHLMGSLEKKSQNFLVKTYNPTHVCVNTNENKHCNARFIAKKLKDRIIDQPNIRALKIQDLVKNIFKIHVGKHTCKRAKTNVLKEFIGDYKLEYQRLYDYKDELLKSNPGSTIVVKVDRKLDPERLVFAGFYVCFSALKEGFKKGCRRCIGFDGCFLKGLCKGQLLAVVARDGNHQMYPIAWAVVDYETKATWSWFLNLVRADLDMDDGAGYTVISDMQKGLVPAIAEILPHAEHRMCARHVLANWSKKWRGVERRNAFWRVSKATFEAQLKDRLEVLDKLGDKIVQDLISYNIEYWGRVYFNTNTKCDSVDNNISETFNGWILGPRHKSIITMLEEIRIKVMERIRDMVEFAEKWITDISPMALSNLQDNTNASMQCNIICNGDSGFEVTEGQYRHVVNLKLLTCSCRAWDLKGIPCPHAIAAMHKMKLDPMNYVSHWYRKHTYLEAYSSFIQPVVNMKMWPTSINPPIEPPEIKTMPGRPKKNRRKSRDEPKKIGNLSKKGAQMTCTYCKGPNYNRRGCSVRKNDISQGIIRDPCEQVQSRKRNKPVQGTSVSNPTKAPNASHSKKELVKKIRYGYGVFHSEKTNFAVQQNGRPGGIVISSGASGVKSSTNVTGDIGFNPTKVKFKGKTTVTSNALQQERAMKRTQYENRASVARASVHNLTQKISNRPMF